MIFISSGHCNLTSSLNFDSGAVGVKGRLEANETVKVKKRVIEILTQKGYKTIQDSDGESLKEYLNRIQPGDASIVIEFHFDAFNGKASGCTGLVPAEYDKNDKNFAAELATVTSTILGIPLRDGGDGDKIMTEADSHRGKLGLMRKAGTVCLLEICFIDNPDDMTKYDLNFEALCQAYAIVIGKYEDLIK